MIKITNTTLNKASISQLLKYNHLPYFVSNGRRKIRWWKQYPDSEELSGYLISQKQALRDIEFNYPEIAQKIKDILDS